MRRGTLERVPRIPQNFPERIIAAITQRSRPVPAFLRSCVAAEIRRGTLERVPRTPQNFPERIIIAVTRRSRPVPQASPYRTLPPRPPPVPRRHSRRGAGGEAPGKTNLWSPPSRREERSASAGRGDGAGRGAKGRADRQPLGQAPAGHSTTTRRIRVARGKPPRRGIATSPPTSSAAQAQPQGCRGRSPRQN